MHVDHRQRLATGNGQRQRLRSVVIEHQLADLIGHVGKHDVALLDRQRTAGDCRAQSDLDIDLVVAAVDPRRVVNRVCVDQSAGEGVLHAPALGEAEIATLPHHLAAQLGAVHPQPVIRAIADLAMRLTGRLHVRSDTAVPQKVDRCTQDDRKQLLRSQRLALGAQPLARRLRDSHGLQRAGIHPAAS